jgi:hypothetical protein
MSLAPSLTRAASVASSWEIISAHLRDVYPMALTVNSVVTALFLARSLGQEMGQEALQIPAELSRSRI